MDGVTYGVTTARMKPGDRLLLYTDGVNEANDPEDRFFGNDGLMKSIKTHADAGDLVSFLAGVREDIRTFAGTAPQSDDITMLAVRYKHDVALSAKHEAETGAENEIAASGAESRPEAGVETGAGHA
jgi:sigma-B regulation protein RsbU (phosphoserine phosphatase)